MLLTLSLKALPQGESQISSRPDAVACSLPAPSSVFLQYPFLVRAMDRDPWLGTMTLCPQVYFRCIIIIKNTCLGCCSGPYHVHEQLIVCKRDTIAGSQQSPPRVLFWPCCTWEENFFCCSSSSSSLCTSALFMLLFLPNKDVGIVLCLSVELCPNLTRHGLDKMCQVSSPCGSSPMNTASSSPALGKAAGQCVHGVPQCCGKAVPDKRFGNVFTVSSPVQVKKPLW